MGDSKLRVLRGGSTLLWGVPTGGHLVRRQGGGHREAAHISCLLRRHVDLLLGRRPEHGLLLLLLLLPSACGASALSARVNLSLGLVCAPS